MNTIVRSNDDIARQMEDDGVERKYECIIGGESIHVRATSHIKAMEMANEVIKKRDTLKEAKKKKTE